MEAASALPDGLIQCPFCRCMFVTKEDLHRHIAFFGRDRHHRDDFSGFHRRLEFSQEAE